jgi:hypothetical protein
MVQEAGIWFDSGYHEMRRELGVSVGVSIELSLHFVETRGH